MAILYKIMPKTDKINQKLAKFNNVLYYLLTNKSVTVAKLPYTNQIWPQNAQVIIQFEICTW